MPATDPYELLKQLWAQYGLGVPPDPKGTPGAEETTEETPGAPIVISPGTPGRPEKTIPGYTPDYNAIVASDPLLAQALRDLSAGGIASEAERRAAVQRSIIGYGETPALSGDLGYLAGDIDPLTQRLAQQNTAAGLSQTARMDRAHKESLSNLQYALAASGMLHSGATGVGIGQEADRYKQNRFDATNQLVNYLAGVSSAYANAKRQQALEMGRARSEARSRAFSENPPVAPVYVPGTDPIPPVTIPGPPTTTTTPAAPATPAYDPYEALRQGRVNVGRSIGMLRDPDLLEVW